jgi:hypothetical protein
MHYMPGMALKQQESMQLQQLCRVHASTHLYLLHIGTYCMPTMELGYSPIYVCLHVMHCLLASATRQFTQAHGAARAGPSCGVCDPACLHIPQPQQEQVIQLTQISICCTIQLQLTARVCHLQYTAVVALSAPRDGCLRNHLYPGHAHGYTASK